MCVQVIIILIRLDLFSYFTLLKGFKRQDIFNLCKTSEWRCCVHFMCKWSFNSDLTKRDKLLTDLIMRGSQMVHFKGPRVKKVRNRCFK